MKIVFQMTLYLRTRKSLSNVEDNRIYHGGGLHSRVQKFVEFIEDCLVYYIILININQPLLCCTAGEAEYVNAEPKVAETKFTIFCLVTSGYLLLSACLIG